MSPVDELTRAIADALRPFGDKPLTTRRRRAMSNVIMALLRERGIVAAVEVRRDGTVDVRKAGVP